MSGSGSTKYLMASQKTSSLSVVNVKTRSMPKRSFMNAPKLGRN